MPGVVKLNPDSVIYDENGHAIGVVLDGAVYRLAVDANLSEWIGSTAPTVGQKAKAASIPVVLPSDQVVPISGGGGIFAGSADIIKTSEFTISTRTEAVLSAVSYTVTTGKTFYLSYVGGMVFAPLSYILRLKVAGTTKIMTMAWQDAIGGIPFPLPILFATSGQQITLTYEAQIPRGTAWAGFTGFEI